MLYFFKYLLSEKHTKIDSNNLAIIKITQGLQSIDLRL